MNNQSGIPFLEYSGARVSEMDHSQKIRELLMSYCLGASIRDVSRTYGIPYSAARRALILNGVKLRPRGRSKKKVQLGDG
jgi:hypothetical protein